ncbi:beta-1,4-galactosyltransferase galt-1-like [Mytilus californianus]|uniref:beta-1,4-galactosyltransferase galt-1-like n=1 Tax=Mytilus californianus TaxID=6549 RepID=UPI002247369D|nr:beta-1,4-galactosyltransferase galt-1-like [Mytilus californianus]
MATRQITRLLLIALGFYIFGLIFFLVGNDVKVKDQTEDHYLPIDEVFVKASNKTTYSYDKQVMLDFRQLHRSNISKPKKSEIQSKFDRLYKLKKTDALQSIKRLKKLGSGKLQMRKRNKNKIDNKELTNQDYWDSLKNLTFKEKVDHILKIYRIRNSTTNLKLRSITTVKQHTRNDNTTDNNNQKKENTKYHYTGEINSALTKSNVGFLKVAEDIFIYASYYDDRKETRFIRNVIITRSAKNFNQQLWCHFWNPTINGWESSGLEFYETCENHLKTFAAYIGSCKIPGNVQYDHIYISNSDDANNEEMKNIIPVIQHSNKSEVKGDLAVCVPPLFGNVNSLRLLEFIEFSIILGYKHFTFYSQNVTNETLKILKLYQKEGLVTILDWPLPVQEDWIWYHGQSAAVWDCLYRNMYVFKHVAFLDIDEIIFPRYDEMLPNFIDKTIKLYHEQESEGGDICAFRFQSAYFDPLQDTIISDIFDFSDNIERHLVTLNSISRKEDFSTVRTKMIVDPIKIFEIGIHHVSKPMEEHFQVENINPEIAYIHHYRKCQSNFGGRCVGRITDNHARRYRNRLLTRLKWRFYHLFKEIL